MNALEGGADTGGIEGKADVEGADIGGIEGKANVEGADTGGTHVEGVADMGGADMGGTHVEAEVALLHLRKGHASKSQVWGGTGASLDSRIRR